MKFRGLLLCIVVASFCTYTEAQTSGKVVKVKAEQEVYKVSKGGSVPAAVVIDIDPGYHINSNRPTDKFLIATALKLAPTAGLAASPVRYPKAKMEKFSFSDKPLSVYEGKAVLRFTARALPAAAVGNHTLNGKVTIQACNNEVCLRPQTVDVSVRIEVTN
ncbi:MAG TPA: protein-disulfide reductase DsbD N-terminal domain-containing protein [Blastocatellia bacterium]|jgi:thiol:disulfide interchange protein DsbD|nr:protein-disulfide reductase DsbD N-terminal domain-containing protein [Blastocatellia bacterium]